MADLKLENCSLWLGGATNRHFPELSSSLLGFNSSILIFHDTKSIPTSEGKVEIIGKGYTHERRVYHALSQIDNWFVRLFFLLSILLGITLSYKFPVLDTREKSKPDSFNFVVIYIYVSRHIWALVARFVTLYCYNGKASDVQCGVVSAWLIYISVMPTPMKIGCARLTYVRDV